ncbi:uncharacterized protein LOC131074323 [Cryptomeria japonica]|uniref:uncharacterized protein LOC131074323 n=1 Tax=Cryptomeria japonica TaxID=3369 RepID=UPI0027D9E6EE|nr:uncharacterized protein LOC131074323 [Cryptomeria japonica]
MPLINWDTLCLVKEEGDAGLRKMGLQNSALGAKLTWKMCKEPQKPWCRLFQKKYLDSDDPNKIISVANSARGSATWNFLWENRNIITDHMSWQIGNGKAVLFWHDSWEGFPTLATSFDETWVCQVENEVGKYVCDYMLENGERSAIRKWKKLNIGDPL